MPALSLLRSLSAAERALGRLDATLADPDRRQYHRLGAQRRTVVACLKLNGDLVAEDDLLLMTVAVDTVPPGARGAAARAVASFHLAQALDTGRFGTDGAVVQEGIVPMPADAGVATAGLRAAREGLSLLAIPVDERLPPARTKVPEVALPPLTPWSRDWVLAAFQAWLAAEGLPRWWHDGVPAALAAGILAIERTLAATPGLEGAVRVLFQLHHCDDPPLYRRLSADPFENPAVRRARELAHARAYSGFWSTLARLAAPALLRRACGLDHAYLPLVIASAAAAETFRSVLAGFEDAAVVWLLERIVEQTAVELAVVRSIERCTIARRIALQGRRRDSGAVSLLDFLWVDPVLTVRRAAMRLGVTDRAARMAIAELVDAGILRGITAWRQDDRPAGRVSLRPLAYLATMFAVPPVRLSKSSRHRDVVPPAGTPMTWQPIDTAPHDGKRCLVWVGYPTLAAYRRVVLDDAPAWRDGRRVLQPTHWLPIVSPGPLTLKDK